MVENLAFNIPHQGPMRWLNSAIVQTDGWIIGQYHVAADHPFLYKGRLPRATIIELIAQTAAAGSQTFRSGTGVSLGDSGMLIALRDVQFYDHVSVGTALELHVRVLQHMGSMFRCEGKAFCETKLICAGGFSFFLRKL